MSTVTASEPTTTGPPTHPALRAIADDLLTVARLAAEKAVAHAGDPATYPMPETSDSLEHLMLDRFQQLAQDKRQRAIDRARAAASETATARRERYGEMADVDLASAASVMSQADAIVARRHEPSKANARAKAKPDDDGFEVDTTPSKE